MAQNSERSGLRRPDPDLEKRGRGRAWLAAALIVVAAGVVYWPSWYGGFVIDDVDLVSANPLIKDSQGLGKIWFSQEPLDYWPLTMTSFWLEWRLWGEDPTGYHIVNLTLHILACLLLWRTLARLEIPGAYLAALLFAVHPVNVESVAWIAQRKNTLSMVFFLLSVLAYVEFDIRGRWRWYSLSLLACLLAMLSKGSVAMLPILLLIVIAWRRRLAWSDVAKIVPLAAICAPLVYVNIWFQTHGSGLVFRHASLLDRLLGAGAAVWFYLSKAVAPVGLVFFYPLWKIDASDWRWWAPLFFALLVTGLLAWRHDGWRRPLLFAWLFFCVALVPVLGFTDVGFMRYSLVADRYQHIALIAVVTLAAGTLTIVSRRSPVTAGAIAISAVGACGFLAWQQSELFVNAETLYTDTLKKNDRCWLLRFDLGALLPPARFEEAEIQYRECLKINPDFAPAHANLAVILMDRGDFEASRKELDQAIELDRHFADPLVTLGGLLVRQGRAEEAIAPLNRALEINGDNPGARNNLGDTYVALGRFEEARQEYEWALKIDESLTETRRNLAVVLRRLGKADAAIEQLELVLKTNPNDMKAQYNLGLYLLEADRADEARAHFRRALELRPDNLNFCIQLAESSAKSGHYPEAASAARQALSMAQRQSRPVEVRRMESLLASLEASGSLIPNSPPTTVSQP